MASLPSSLPSVGFLTFFSSFILLTLTFVGPCSGNFDLGITSDYIKAQIESHECQFWTKEDIMQWVQGRKGVPTAPLIDVLNKYDDKKGSSAEKCQFFELVLKESTKPSDLGLEAHELSRLKVQVLHSLEEDDDPGSESFWDLSDIVLFLFTTIVGFLGYAFLELQQDAGDGASVHSGSSAATKNSPPVSSTSDKKVRRASEKFKIRLGGGSQRLHQPQNEKQTAARNSTLVIDEPRSKADKVQFSQGLLDSPQSLQQQQQLPKGTPSPVNATPISPFSSGNREERKFELSSSETPSSPIGRTPQQQQPPFFPQASQSAHTDPKSIHASFEDEGSRYELQALELVGSGYFGSVYRGMLERIVLETNESLVTEVAIKVVPHGLGNSREVEILQCLSHPNVIEFIGAVSQEQIHLLLVTAYAQGRSVFSFLHSNNITYSVRWVYRVAEEIAEGMRYLEEEHIVHRDLKSSNILLALGEGETNCLEADSLHAKIADFGLSRNINQATQMTGTPGTPAWMAPEIIKAQDTDGKCDVFSYAVVLWELLTRQVPWDGMEIVQILFTVCEKNRLPVPPDSPRLFRDIIELSWRDDPDDRPSFADICKLFQQHPYKEPSSQQSLVESQATWSQDISRHISALKILYRNAPKTKKETYHKLSRGYTIH